MWKPILALLVGLAWTATASAQTATIVKNEDEPLRDYYQQVGSATDCANNNTCTITYPQITGSNRTVVTRVQCSFSMADPGVIQYAQLESQPANLWAPLQVFAYADVDAYTEYGINSAVYMVFTHLQHPFIAVGWHGAEVANLKCLLTGYTVNLSK